MTASEFPIHSVGGNPSGAKVSKTMRMTAAVAAATGTMSLKSPTICRDQHDCEGLQEERGPNEAEGRLSEKSSVGRTSAGFCRRNPTKEQVSMGSMPKFPFSFVSISMAEPSLINCFTHNKAALLWTESRSFRTGKASHTSLEHCSSLFSGGERCDACAQSIT